MFTGMLDSGARLSCILREYLRNRTRGVIYLVVKFLALYSRVGGSIPRVGKTRDIPAKLIVDIP
jgi:hypothetical protein